MEEESDDAGDISEQVFDRGKYIVVVSVRPLAPSVVIPLKIPFECKYLQHHAFPNNFSWSIRLNSSLI